MLLDRINHIIPSLVKQNMELIIINIAQNKYILDQYLLEMIDQNRQMIIQDQIAQSEGRRRIKNRFRKYKQILNQNVKPSKVDKLQYIFSHLHYIPIQIESDNGESSNSKGMRNSIVQTEYSELGDTSIDSFLSASSHSFTVIGQLQYTNQYDMKKPSYIRQFNKLNSIIPNYLHPQFSVKNQIKNLNNLIKLAQTAILHVFNCAMKIQIKKDNVKVFPPSNPETLTLQFFLNSGWQNVKLDQNTQMLRPYENFVSKHQFDRVLNHLDLLLVKITRYQLAASLTQQIGLQLYKSIRDNLLEVQEKLMECSNSIYYLSIQNQYPFFYYKYLQILRNGTKSFKLDQIKQLIFVFRKLWDVEQPVTNSEIGQAVWSKLYDSDWQNQNQ